MGGALTRAFQSWYAKALVAAILLGAGAVGGIYLGDSLIRPKAVGAQQQQTSLSLKLGDLFPMLSYTAEGGQTEEFERLLVGKRTVLLFVRKGCRYCDNLLVYWNKQIAPILDTAVNVVVCLQSREIPPSVSAMGGRKMVVYPDSQVYSLIGVRFSPTVVGTDQYGFVTYTSVGFADELDRKFHEVFATTAKK